MKRIIAALALCLLPWSAAVAQAPTQYENFSVYLNAQTAASAINGSEVVYILQNGLPFKTTTANIVGALSAATAGNGLFAPGTPGNVVIVGPTSNQVNDSGISLSSLSSLNALGFAAAQGSLTINNPGSGYAAGNTITLSCPGVTFTTSPVIYVQTASGPIAAAIVRNQGVTSNIPSSSIVCNQLSTSGSGINAQFTLTFAPIVAGVNGVSLVPGDLLVAGNGPDQIVDSSTLAAQSLSATLPVGLNINGTLTVHAAINGVTSLTLQGNGTTGLQVTSGGLIQIPTSLQFTGNTTIAVDTTTGTFATAQYRGAGYLVDPSGNTTALTFIPTGSACTANEVYLPSAATIGLCYAGTAGATFATNTVNLAPAMTGSSSISARNTSGGSGASLLFQLGNNTNASEFSVTVNGAANAGGNGANSSTVNGLGGLYFSGGTTLGMWLDTSGLLHTVSVLGGVTTQSGVTYTFAATDCGTLVRFTSGSAIVATIPVTLVAGCNIAVEQVGTAKVSVNGSAVSPATLHTHLNSGSATGTSGQYAIVGITLDANGVAVLTGDGL